MFSISASNTTVAVPTDATDTTSANVGIGPLDRTESSDASSAQVWTNPTQPLDVNGDGVVTALDALIVINAINQWNVGPVTRLAGQTTAYLDVNGDGLLSPTDVLTIVNQLNQTVGAPNPAVPIAALGQLPADAESGANALTFNGSSQVATQAAFQVTLADDYLPVDVSQTYLLSGWARSGDGQGGAYDPANLQYFGYAAYDVDKNQITALDVSKVAGAQDTYLAQPLKPGDTQIVLQDATGWYDGDNAGMRSLAWYGYQDSTGHTYADFTYTRNVVDNAWVAGAIQGNVITLSSPWTGPALAAGAAIRNATDGPTYSYAAMDAAAVPAEQWRYYAATISGVQQDGAQDFQQFPPGTAYIRPVILSNYQGLADNQVTWLDVNWQVAPAGPLDPLPGTTGDMNAELQQLILNALPDLNTLLTTDPLTAARMIVGWTATAANWSFSDSIAQATTTQAASETPGEMYFTEFLPDKGAGYCQLQSMFTDGVLKLFGFDSFVYSFGDLQNNLTHATVVVPIWNVDQWRYFIIDPSFNMTFVNSTSGEQLDVFQMLDMLADGEGSQIGTVESSVDGRTYLDDSPCDQPGISQIGISGSLSLYSWVGWGYDTYLAANAVALQQAGYSQSGAVTYVQLMANCTFSVGASLDDSARAQFIAELDSRGIPSNLG